MAIKIYDLDKDDVIKSYVASGKANYSFALDKLYSLVDRFSAQRKMQSVKFYERLKADLIKGCLMPPITIAFVSEKNTKFKNTSEIQKYINKNIKHAFILDGIQRLNTLHAAHATGKLKTNKAIYINVIIAPSESQLVYRMITLNNGQKPMTPTHQIEILTQGAFNFKKLGIDVQTEKERGQKIVRNSFKAGDISKAHTAFLANNVHNESNKIISEKMDEIIANRILETKRPASDIDFKDVLRLVGALSANSEAKKWFQVNNNLIGFSVGVRDSYKIIKTISPKKFEDAAELFEKAFNGIDPSKINLGRYRRELSREFIKNYKKYSKMDAADLLASFAELMG